MHRFTILIAIGLLAAAQPAASQTFNVPRQSAPVASPQVRAQVLRAPPPIRPLTPVQRAQVVQQLTGATSTIGQTLTLTPTAAVVPGGASFRFVGPIEVNFVTSTARFSGASDQWTGGFLEITLPNWPAGLVLVDCAVTSTAATFFWRHYAGSGPVSVQGAVPLVNNHVLLVASTSGPSQTVGITTGGDYWTMSSCELTRVG
jgi:hypothetical protein